MTVEYLPDGGALVTLGDDGMYWTALDVFSWVAFRETRLASDGLESVLFPRVEWSRDWVRWPAGGLATPLAEIATGVLCLHPEGSPDETFADGGRAWAREVVARNRESPRELLDALARDVERHGLARIAYQNAREAVHAAIRDGHLQVWARKAHGLHRPNRNADHEPLEARVFTVQPREVNESGWVGTLKGDDGPWWDEARLDPEQVLTLWPSEKDIGALAPPPAPFPGSLWIAPWVAAAWKAFEALGTPGHIISHRSFDGGTSKLPYETKAQHAARQEEHRRFDAAEREVMNLLASGQVKVEGQPPAKDAPGKPRPGKRKIVPASTFRDQRLAFEPDGTLVVRLNKLGRLFPDSDVRGTEASPEYPLWHDLLIEAVGLREAWSIADVSSPPACPERAKVPVAAETPLPTLPKRKHTGKDYRADDAPLVEEMRRMIEACEAPSATNAARSVVKRAKGAATVRDDSKVARLVMRYGRTYPAV